MPTYDATEAHKHVKAEMMEDFKKAFREAEAEGKEVYSVFISGGVPVLYNIRDRT